MQFVKYKMVPEYTYNSAKIESMRNRMVQLLDDQSLLPNEKTALFEEMQHRFQVFKKKLEEAPEPPLPPAPPTLPMPKVVEPEEPPLQRTPSPRPHAEEEEEEEEVLDDEPVSRRSDTLSQKSSTSSRIAQRTRQRKGAPKKLREKPFVSYETFAPKKKKKNQTGTGKFVVYRWSNS